MMINIKRLFFVCILFTFFLNENDVVAQKYNQFDENKKRTGPWKKYYQLNKRIKYIGQFENGKEVGTFKFYNIKYSTHPEAIKVFTKGSDLVKVTYLYDNGKKAEVSEYKNGVLHGVSKKYSDKEVLIEEVLYQNGLANGLAKYYELSGSLKERGIYKNGKRIGKWEFYLDGEMIDEKKQRELRKNQIKQKN